MISPLCVSPSGGALQMACSCLEPDYSIPTLLLRGQQGLLSCAVPRVPAAASWYCQAHFSTSSVRHHLWFSGWGTLVYSCSASTRHWTAANVGLILIYSTHFSCYGAHRPLLPVERVRVEHTNIDIVHLVKHSGTLLKAYSACGGADMPWTSNSSRR